MKGIAFSIVEEETFSPINKLRLEFQGVKGSQSFLNEIWGDDSMNSWEEPLTYSPKPIGKPEV